MSTYYEVTFRPRAVRPGEVTLLIPNIFNTGETVPVNVPQSELMNIYMSIFRHQLAEDELVDDYDDQNYGQATAGQQRIPPEW